MIGTFFSLVLAIFIFLTPAISDTNLDAVLLSGSMVVVGMIFLILAHTGIALSWLPLQKAEQNMTPRILELVRKDWHMRLTLAWMVVFPLISLTMALDTLYTHHFSRDLILAIWILFLGIAIDASQHRFKRTLSYLSPFAVIEMFGKEAESCIRNEQEIDLCHWIDALSEVSIKATERHSSSISHASLNEQQQIARLFFQSSKSISHHTQDNQTRELGISDKVSYVMFYLYQRLDLEFDKALKNRSEPTCSQIIVILGKVAIDAANYDISMASAPLRFLGKFAVSAQKEELHETEIKASCTVLGVARAILNDIDITYLELQDPFFSIINTLEELSKGAFKKNKSIDIALLTQPFIELKALFAEGKAQVHQDTSSILQQIDRVLGEFDALQMVMNTLPIIPKTKEEKVMEQEKEEEPPQTSPSP